MDNNIKQIIEELKQVTYDSRPNIKYQEQMDLIERLENGLNNQNNPVMYIVDEDIKENPSAEFNNYIEEMIQEQSTPKLKGKKPKSSQ